MDWLDILKIHRGLRFFFDVSILAAITERTTGHILLVCPDSAVRTHFAEELVKVLTPLTAKEDLSAENTSISDEELLPRRHVNWNRGTQPGEIAAAITALSPKELLILNREEIALSSEVAEMLHTAMGSFALDIVLGKDVNAKSIRLDLPEFTFVVCAAKETADLNKLESHFSYVIKIDKEQLKPICEKTAIMKAQERGYSLTDEACEFISECAGNDCMTAVGYTMRIIEYVQQEYPIGTRIAKEHAREVLESLGIISLTNEEVFSKNEVRTMIREIRKRLDRIEKILDSKSD